MVARNQTTRLHRKSVTLGNLNVDRLLLLPLAVVLPGALSEPCAPGELRRDEELGCEKCPAGTQDHEPRVWKQELSQPRT